MKDKADNSLGRGRYELTQGYKSYAEYEFPEKQTRHPRCENSADSVLCTPTNYECKCPIGNVFCGSLLSVVLLLSQELKWIHQSEYQISGDFFHKLGCNAVNK